MTNSAFKLHEILVGWARKATPTASPQSTRGLGLPMEDRDGHWPLQREAVQHLHGCIVAIDNLERAGVNVSAYRSNVNRWVAMVINFPYTWQQPYPQGEREGPFKKGPLDVLHTLGVLIEARGPQLVPEKSETLRQVIVSVKTLLAEDESLSGQMRAHVVSVVTTLEGILDNAETYAPEDVARAARDLWVAIYAAAGQTSDAKRSRWRDLGEQIIPPTVAGVLASLPSLGMQAIGMLP